MSGISLQGALISLHTAYHQQSPTSAIRAPMLELKQEPRRVQLPDKHLKNADKLSCMS